MKQDGPRRKRWFRDASFDIYTWQNAQGAYETLQLCYNMDRDEHVLSWDVQSGYRHERVDAPEDKPGRAMSPIFRADGVFPAALVLQRFAPAAQELPADVVQFIEKRIREYSPASPHERMGGIDRQGPLS
jgi:hypothetical protein